MNASDTTLLTVILCVGLVIYLVVAAAALVYAVRVQLSVENESPHQEEQDRNQTDTTVPSEWTTQWPTPVRR